MQLFPAIPTSRHLQVAKAADGAPSNVVDPVLLLLLEGQPTALVFTLHPQFVRGRLGGRLLERRAHLLRVAQLGAHQAKNYVVLPGMRGARLLHHLGRAA